MWRKKTAIREKWKWITAETMQKYMFSPRLFMKGVLVEVLCI